MTLAALLTSGLFSMTVVVFVIVLFIFGPANLAAFFMSPSIYTVLIGIVVALFVVRRVGK